MAVAATATNHNHLLQSPIETKHQSTYKRAEKFLAKYADPHHAPTSSNSSSSSSSSLVTLWDDEGQEKQQRQVVVRSSSNDYHRRLPSVQHYSRFLNKIQDLKHKQQRVKTSTSSTVDGKNATIIEQNDRVEVDKKTNNVVPSVRKITPFSDAHASLSKCPSTIIDTTRIRFHSPSIDWMQRGIAHLRLDGLVGCPQFSRHHSFAPHIPPTRIIQVHSDGSCLFRCFSFIVTGTEEYHREMRAAIVDEIESNQSNQWNVYLGGIETHSSNQHLRYLNSGVRQCGSGRQHWGSDIEIQAFMKIFHCLVYTYHSQYQWIATHPFFDGINDSWPTVFLRLSFDHFDVCLEPNGEICKFDTMNKLFERRLSLDVGDDSSSLKKSNIKQQFAKTTSSRKSM